MALAEVDLIEGDFKVAQHFEGGGAQHGHDPAHVSTGQPHPTVGMDDDRVAGILQFAQQLYQLGHLVL